MYQNHLRFYFREVKSFADYDPVFGCFIDYGEVLTAYAQWENTKGTFYIFVNFDRLQLNGKKIQVRWKVGAASPPPLPVFVEVYDGSYDRTNDNDFPENQSTPLLKGNGLLQTIFQQESTDGEWVETNIAEIDTSGGKESQCCLMFRFVDAWATMYSIDSEWLYIDWIKFYTNTGELWIVEDFDPPADILYEQDNTIKDYGYISFNDPPEPPVTLPEDEYSYTKGGKDMFVTKSVYVPKFTVSELPGIVFGGFIVDKYVCSQPGAGPSNGSPVIAHGESPRGTAARSAPGVPAWDYIKMAQAMIACCNRGKGWHLITPFEWAAIAWMSKKLNSQPRGPNANTNPPSDADCPFETAILDRDLLQYESGAYRALTGTGPASWAHNGQPVGGIYDLNGVVWQWVMAFMTTDGYLRYPANFNLTYLGSPFGRGTITGSGGATPTLTCNGSGGNWLKEWQEDEFNGSQYSVFIAEANDTEGALYQNIQDTTPTTIVLPNGADPGDGIATFVILKTGSTDITQGMLSENLITSLITDISSDLSRMTIPATSDETGSEEFGYDVYSFDQFSERGMVRGGAYNTGKGAGVFSLSFSNDPDSYLPNIGFRASKAL